VVSLVSRWGAYERLQHKAMHLPHDDLPCVGEADDLVAVLSRTESEKTRLREHESQRTRPRLLTS
jgi:hypothetical protein